MSRKQEIYRQMLEMSLPHIRTVLGGLQGHSFFDAIRRGREGDEVDMAFEVAQFIHTILPSLFDEEFTDHDIWMMNTHAMVFTRSPIASRSPLYPPLMRLLRELFTLVPEPAKARLNWAGPDEEAAHAKVPVDAAADRPTA
jgi:hypothetical protein